MSDFSNKKEPINDGKDIPKFDSHEIYTLSGKTNVLKMNNDFKFTCFEPKRNNRWMLKFSGSFEEVPSWSVKKTHRPKLKNGSWGNIKIKFYDAIGPSTTQAIVNGFRNSWQVNNRNSETPIIKYNICMLDPTGTIIEEWAITGKIINADFGELDWASSKLSSIKLIIKPISVILLY